MFHAPLNGIVKATNHGQVVRKLQFAVWVQNYKGNPELYTGRMMRLMKA